LNYFDAFIAHHINDSPALLGIRLYSQWVSKKPKNFSLSTPKIHFSGLSHRLYSLKAKTQQTSPFCVENG